MDEFSRRNWERTTELLYEPKYTENGYLLLRLLVVCTHCLMEKHDRCRAPRGWCYCSCREGKK